MYPDVVQIYTNTCKENIDSCVDCINRDLVRIDNWASTNELGINPSKFKCIILSKSDRSFVIPALSIRGNKIDFVFNSRLSWSNHISDCMNECILYLNNSKCSTIAYTNYIML